MSIPFLLEIGGLFFQLAEDLHLFLRFLRLSQAAVDSAQNVVVRRGARIDGDRTSIGIYRCLQLTIRLEDNAEVAVPIRLIRL